ncbi:MAG: serine/threonine-protein kinase [Acidimicrobiales bacterium]
MATTSTVVGGYELWARIGVGATGTVWKAHRRGPVPHVVAMKRLRATVTTPAELARIQHEAAVLTELDHPHIVRLIDVLEDGDALAIAMQLAAGGSLEALLAERGQLRPGEVVAVAAPIADALWSAHRRGIIHGDVKAANILFTSDGAPLLADFDVARSLGRMTRDQVAGTAEYVAPELLRGALPDQRSDIYSLGVVCHEALFGYIPCTGAVPEPSVRSVETDRPLADTIERAMARDPNDRFPSADAFARALRDSVAHEVIGLPRVPATAVAPDDEPARSTRTFGPQPPRPETRPRWWWRVPGVRLVARVVRAGLRRQPGRLPHQ